MNKAFDSHMNLILSDLEESQIDENTKERVTRKMKMVFLRGD